ncbi:hypothetical protein BN948_01736 [Hydrogenophaga intermedia]|uniref:Uncharacterized protein n=1 Tax=Hydrogenophaga intermedia TaxID=65786 RepID=A0A1L1PMQ0_HYDIT|nr:hypothetical protein [Hydrogenophaga intermedia]CDN87316.1 hypothetical protein BN948_01736 [Hydrogenophaga intermedia]
MSDFRFERYEAFGWIVHRKILAVGERFEVHANGDIDVANAPDVAVWTRGRVLVEEQGTGRRLPDRQPGDSILRRGRTQAGRFVCTAAEPSEFWCINRVANRRRQPKLAVLDAEPGRELRLVRNALLCEGRVRVGDVELAAPQALAKGARVVVLERAIGFLFME